MAITFQTIQSTTLSSNQGAITFSNIPQTYSDLYLYVSARTTRGSVVDAINLKINGNGTPGNYFLTTGWGNSNSSMNGSYYNAFDEVAYVDGASAVANKFGATLFRINGYADNNAYGKHWAALSAGLGTSGGNPARWNFGGCYFNVAGAITTIEVLPVTGPQLAATSSATLYGIKKA